MSILESRNIEKAITALLVILSLFFVVFGINKIKEGKFIGGGVPVSNTISVSGEGEVFAVPDIAQFSFSVEEERKTVEEAQAEATRKTNEIVEFLKSQNIDDKDLRTTGYNVYPRYEWRTVATTSKEIGYYPPTDRTQVLMGYRVTQSMSVKVRDIDTAGDVLAGVGDRGVSNVSGLSFTIDDTDALEREARQEAIEKAQEKAEDLADDLNVSLVRVVSFSEGGYSPYKRTFDDYMYAESMAMDGGGFAAPSIEPGENRIRSNVIITYEIR